MKIAFLPPALLHNLMIESRSFREFMIEQSTPNVTAFEFQTAVRNLVQKFSPWNEKIAAIKELRTFSQNHMQSFHFFYGPLNASSTTCLGLADAKRIVELYI
jgi:hypothetical protein